MRYKVLIHNNKTGKAEWIDGEIVRTVAGEWNEDFERINVKTAKGFYKECHPDCVRKFEDATIESEKESDT